MKRLIFSLAMFCAGSAMAQDGLTYSCAPTETCLTRNSNWEDRRACIGQAAEACVEATGYATPVLSGCASRELDDWDARLNAVYRDARAQAQRRDADAFSGAPSQAEAIRDMQRAWIPFRDATCTYEASQWGGGTGAGPAYVNCLLRLTAEQALYLEHGGLGE